MIGISKKVWESFCANNSQSTADRYPTNLSHAVEESFAPAPSSHDVSNRRGFCNVVLDHYCTVCFGTDQGAQGDAIIPDGMSVSSTDSSNNNNNNNTTSGVDLSPQCPPQEFSSSAEYATVTSGDRVYMPINLTLDNVRKDDGTFIDDEDEEDKVEPLTEYDVTNHSHHLVKVLLATLLAVYMAIILLHHSDTVSRAKIHFILQPKARVMFDKVDTGRRQDFIVFQMKPQKMFY